VTAVKSDASVKVEEGRGLIPERYLRAHASSLGVPWSEYEARMGDASQLKIARGNVKAFVSAQDFQYTTTREVLSQVLPLTESAEDFFDALYSPIFEAALDRAGLWRVSTEHYYAHHLGNRRPKPSEIAEVFGMAEIRATTPLVDQSARAGRNRLRQNRFFRKALKALNSWTYRMLFG
jgi:hypothetical protein